MMTAFAAGLLALALAGAPALDPEPVILPISQWTPGSGPALLQQARGPGPFHLEVRAGIGTGEFHGSGSGSNRSAGANWGIRMGFRSLEHFVLGVGYGRSSFGCEGGLCAQFPVRYSGSGFEVGAAADWRAVRLGAGVTRQTLVAEWSEGEGVRATSESAPTMGWFADLSVDVPVTPRFSVAPGVRYMRHGADFGTGVSRATVQVMADVGVRYRLPFGR
jgi:hypothetical protein